MVWSMGTRQAQLRAVRRLSRVATTQQLVPGNRRMDRRVVQCRPLTIGPNKCPASRRTPGFFTFEGLPLLLGRDFLPEEGQPGRDHVVILSHRLWAESLQLESRSHRQRHSHERRTLHRRRRAAAGHARSLQLAVVGAAVVQARADRARLKLHVLVMARLKDGVSLAQAQAEMDGIAAQLQSEFPQTNANRGVSVAAVAPQLRDRIDASQSLAVARRGWFPAC